MKNAGTNTTSGLALAMEHHRAGRLGQAAQIYQGIIAQDPRHADALRLLGVVAHQLGSDEVAVDLLRQAIMVNSGIAEYHNDLGLALHGLGRYADAVGACQTALGIQPNLAEGHYNLANSLRALGRADQAVASYQLAMELRPEYPEAANNLGNALKDQGQYDLAAMAFRRALELRPRFAEAQSNLGNALQMAGKLEEAIGAYQAALRLKADDAQTLNNLGCALAERGDGPLAMEYYQMALQVNPRYADAHFNVGNALLKRERPEEAAAAFRAAIGCKEKYPEAQINLGNALQELGQKEAALAAYRTAVELAPEMPEAHNNLGVLLRNMGQVDEAVAAFHAAIARREAYADAWSNLGGALKEQGRMSEALAAYRRSVELSPDAVQLNNNLIYALHFDPAYDPRAVAGELAAYQRRFAEPLARDIRPLAVDRSIARPLRIGLVSPDFRSHPIGRFVLPLLRGHDKTACAIFCYSDGKVAAGARDPLTQAIKAHADRWHDTRKLLDRELAGLIRIDGVDVLVDLTMHMDGSRLLTLAQRPAPVQVTYLAYAGSTGLEMVDYRMTDAAFEGAGEAAVYREKPLVLRSYWCYPVPEEAPAVAPLPARSAGRVTFGCLNNFSKVSPQALAAWGEILRRVPGSRLILHAAPGNHRERVRQALAGAGVEPQQVEFYGFLPFSDYLGLHGQIDIGLDPFPYAGGTTTCDAMYMGVPVVTLAGRQALSRGGVSIMEAVGMPELVAASMEGYVRLAAELARDLGRLGEMRAGLRGKMRGSVLMDERGFAQDFVGKMRWAWEEFVRGLPAAAAH